MSRTFAVMAMTLRRHVRSRVVWVAGAIAVATLGLPQAALVSTRLAYGGDVAATEVVMSGLFALTLPIYTFLTCLVGAATAASCIRNDIAQGTIYSVLSKPLARTEYLVGSLLGSVAVVLFAWLVFVVGASTIALLAHAPLGAKHYAAIGGYVLPTIVASCIAIFIATRFNVWASIGLTILILNGRPAVERVATLLDLPAAVTGALSFPFPIGNAVGVLARHVFQDDLVPAPVLPGIVHLVDYALVMVVLACLSFRRLELNRSSD